MRVPLRGFGQLGVIHDTVGEALPVGAWSDSRNVRFTGVELQKMLEPGGPLPWIDVGEDPQWMQLWSDGFSTYAAIATDTQIYFWRNDGQTSGPAPAPVPDTGVWNPSWTPFLGAPNAWIYTDSNQNIRATVAAQTISTIPSTERKFVFAFDPSEFDADNGRVGLMMNDTPFLGLPWEIDSAGVFFGGAGSSWVGALQPFPWDVSGPPAVFSYAVDMDQGYAWMMKDGNPRNSTIADIENGVNPDILFTPPDSDVRAFVTASSNGINPVQLFSYFQDPQPYSITGYRDGLAGTPPSSGQQAGFEPAGRTGGYQPGGEWQSFAWGDTCVFNNGLDAPQIYDSSIAQFKDLPNWGIISTADDILANRGPTKNVNPRCTVLFPLKGFLVACGITEGGRYQPNTIWWSDVTSLATYVDGPNNEGPPSWDYESPATLSGKLELDPESGAIRTARVLNENGIIYTDGSANALTVVGGRFVMNLRRLFNKGAAGLHSVAEFNNQHFVVARDQLYLHDGSTVALIAKDRVEDEFFTRIGKGGRFGSGVVEWGDMQVVKNPDRKEIHVNFDNVSGDRESLVWNFEDNNFTWMDASVIVEGALDPVVCMAYGFEPGWQVSYQDQLTEGVTYQDELDGVDPWGDGSTGTLYDNLYYAGKERDMFWLSSTGIYKADQEIDTSGVKSYFVERTEIDLDDVIKQWSSQQVKYMDEFLFLLQSPQGTTENPNNFDFTPGYSMNLMDPVTWKPATTVNLQSTANGGAYKVNFRATGRYLAMRMDFTATQEINMTGGDLNAEEVHGR